MKPGILPGVSAGNRHQARSGMFRRRLPRPIGSGAAWANLAILAVAAAYCNATRIAMSPRPLARGCSAFPITAPKARP